MPLRAPRLPPMLQREILIIYIYIESYGKKEHDKIYKTQDFPTQ